jgi:hypothetical protein
MVKREHPAPARSRPAPQDRTQALLVSLSRYAATFDLMLSAWRDRSIYETVKDDLDAVMAGQKALYPEAGVAMMGLAMAHSDIAAVLLEMHVADSRGLPSKFTPQDVAARRSRHEAAVEELRGYILRKTH